MMPPMPAATADQRRRAYVAWIADRFEAIEPDMTASDGRRWALNHARLLLAHDPAKANRYFETFELTADADICFIRFLKTYLDYREPPRLSDAAKAHIRELLAAWPVNDLTTVAGWPAIHTENHDLMQLTIGMFAEQQRGHDTSPHVREILKFLAWRFQRGFVEWNSPCYQFHVSNPLLVLADHAPSDRLRQAAAELLNVMFAERVVLGVNGYLGGPALRCRTADANHSLTARKVAYLEDNRYDGFLPLVWLALGLGEPRFDFAHSRVGGLEPAGPHYASANEPRLKQDEGMFLACSRFRVHPIIEELAREAQSRPALVYSGQRFLGWPDFDDLWATQKWVPGSIHYYNTPDVSMGSLHSDGWSHQTRYSNVMFAADPSQNLRVELILPGVAPHKRRHEARGRVVQHNNWLLGQGTLFEDGGAAPVKPGPWNLYRVGKGLCAHFALPDEYHVLQVSDLDTHPSEEAFVRALSVPEILDQHLWAVTEAGDRIVVDLRDMGIAINGRQRPHPEPMLHNCECMRSQYGSGRITVRTRTGTVTFGAFACEQVG